jgi:hypothetical protein
VSAAFFAATDRPTGPFVLAAFLAAAAANGGLHAELKHARAASGLFFAESQVNPDLFYIPYELESGRTVMAKKRTAVQRPFQ